MDDLVEPDSDAEQEDQDENKTSGRCCCVAKVQESYQLLFPGEAVPKNIIRQLKLILANSETMMSTLGFDTDQRKNERHLDSFEKLQRDLNKLIKQARDDAQVIVRSKLPRASGEAMTVDQSRSTMKARQTWKTLIPQIESKFKALEALHVSTTDEAKESWVNDPGSGPTPKQLTERQKTVGLIKNQIEQIKQMVEGTLKQRVRSLQEKANKAAETLRQLSPDGMPDLDPESWEHYNKYLQKDLEIDRYFDELYEQNVKLLEKGGQVYETQKELNAGFELLEEKVDEAAIIAEKAVTMAQKINRWLKARGAGMVCIYVLMLLLVLGVAYAIYQTWYAE